MNYLGKFDVRFVTFVKNKYKRRFKTFDDYVFFLEEHFNIEEYYARLEDDIREFVIWQEEIMKRW